MNNYSIYKYTGNNGYERGYYEPIDIPFDDTTDYYYIIPSGYDCKPGNLSYELFGTPKLYWIFSYFNKDIIVDPIFDIQAGLKIRVPDKDRLLSYF